MLDHRFLPRFPLVTRPHFYSIDLWFKRNPGQMPVKEGSNVEIQRESDGLTRGEIPCGGSEGDELRGCGPPGRCISKLILLRPGGKARTRHYPPPAPSRGLWRYRVCPPAEYPIRGRPGRT